MTLPELAVKRPVSATMLLLSIFVLGLVALFRLDLAFLPEQENKQLFIVANYDNASPKAVERMVLKPLEDAVASITGIEHLNSSSDSRGARVRLNMSLSANMDVTRAEIHERIDRIRDQLPEDLERIVISERWNPNESGETILEARLASGRDLSKNYELLYRKIVKPLERIPGVALVTLDGVEPREVRIKLKLNKLKQYNLSAGDVWATLNANSRDWSVGALRNQQQHLLVRVLGRLTRIQDIENLPIAETNVRITDLAEVSFQEPPLEYGRMLDGEFAIGLSIAKESSANTIAITEQVQKKIDAMQNDPALLGINFLVWQDQGKEIKKTLADLRQTGIFGALLASVALLLFLRRISSTIIAVLCIPLSLLVACGVIWLQGKTLNTISLLGLIVGLGMLVDNAVVMIENIDRYHRKGYSGRIAAILGAREVSIAVITATITSLIVFLPLIFTKPTSFNVLLQELGLTICITLLASLLISQTLIPLCARFFLKSKSSTTESHFMHGIETSYTKVLEWVLKHRWVAIAVAILLLTLTYFPVKQINFNFDESPSEAFVGLNVNFDNAIPLEEKKRVIHQIEEKLAPYKDEWNVQALYGWYSPNWSIFRLYMKSGYQNEESMNALRKVLPDYLPIIPGVKLQIQDSGPFWRRNSGKRVGIQLQGPDTEVLTQLAQEALEKIQTIPDLFDFYSTAQDGGFELHANLNKPKLDHYDVSGEELAGLVAITFRGQRLPSFQSETGEVDTRILLDDSTVTDIDALGQLQISNSQEQVLQINRLADFIIEKGPNRISRENKVSSIWLGARYESGQRSDHMQSLQKRVADIVLPNGYRWEFSGFNRRQNDGEKDFLLNLIMALGLIFAVMASLFESMRQALGLMLAVPFALAGAFWCLYIFNVDFDRPASIAILLLLGIVVNNGIVMIEHINVYRRRGWHPVEAILQGSKERLRPIIMTASTTLVGLVPIAYQQPSLGGIYYYSMAYVIIGGLAVSTILTTLLLPAVISLLTPQKPMTVRTKHVDHAF